MDKAILNGKLFEGVSEAEIAALLDEAGAMEKTVPRGGYIYNAGDKPADVALMLRGEAFVVSYDYWGNRTLHAKVCAGDLFGAAYGVAEELPVSVQTEGGCTALMIPYEKLVVPPENAGRGHIRVMSNIITLLAKKNISQLEKMGHITKRTTREKTLAYLSAESAKSGSRIFQIPFDRRQLADYLAVDRAALSRVLSELRSDGIIDFSKNKFKIK